ALPASAQLHHPGLRPRAGERPHREVRWQGVGARARGEGLRLDPGLGERRRGCGVTEIATRQLGRDDSIVREAVKATSKGTITRAPGSIEIYREDFGRQTRGPDGLPDPRGTGGTRSAALGD